jgi:hypothetical protein
MRILIGPSSSSFACLLVSVFGFFILLVQSVAAAASFSAVVPNNNKNTKNAPAAASPSTTLTTKNKEDDWVANVFANTGKQQQDDTISSSGPAHAMIYDTTLRGMSHNTMLLLYNKHSFLKRRIASISSDSFFLFACSYKSFALSMIDLLA